jgi:lipopolysaccharide biosynthesis glycosyltransferase
MVLRRETRARSQRVFVTHCDINYFSRAYLLIESVSHQEDSTFYLVCDDLETYHLAQKWKLNNMVPIEISSIENLYEELKDVKKNKTHIEYMYCLTPFVIKSVLRLVDRESVVYLDADTFLFRERNQEWLRIGNESVGITPHRFPERLKHLESTGIFNVGVLYFKNDENSKAVLEWWGRKCISDTSTGGTREVFGDQLYLNQFPSMGDFVKIINDEHINLAPWNLETSQDEIIGWLEEGKKPILYHFSGLKLFDRWIILGFASYGTRPSFGFLRRYYIPYIAKLLAVEKNLFGQAFPDQRKFGWKWWLRSIKLLDAIPKFIVENK